jgi:magnesium transporter
MLKVLREGKISWIYADETSEDVLSYMKKNCHAHPLDLEDVQSETHDSKLDIYKNYIFAIFNFPRYDAKTKKISLCKMDVFIGQNFLVTIHRENIDDLSEFFKKIKNNSRLRKDWMAKGADFILFKVLQNLFKTTLRTVADGIASRLTEMEKNVYEIDRSDIEELAALRRNILSMRRLVDPQRSLISSLGTAKVHLIRDEYGPYFDDIRDFLDKIWIRLENYKDTIDGLYETNESLTAYKTNEIMKILTIISVSLMPLTLLASIYGMNIDLPLADRQHFVWGIFVGLAFFMLGIVIFLKKRRWF